MKRMVHGGRGWAVWVMAAAATVAAARPALSQAESPVAGKKTAIQRHAHTAAEPRLHAKQLAKVPVTSVPPSVAQPVTVALNNGQLRIDANHAQLGQVLQAVSAVSGMQVEGLAAVRMVDGAWGPGKPGEVLGQLLEENGYGFAMVGGGDREAPRKLLLVAERGWTADGGQGAAGGAGSVAGGSNGAAALPGGSGQGADVNPGGQGGSQSGGQGASQDGAGGGDAGAAAPGAIQHVPPNESDDATSDENSEARQQQLQQKLQQMQQGNSNPQ